MFSKTVSTDLSWLARLAMSVAVFCLALFAVRGVHTFFRPLALYS